MTQPLRIGIIGVGQIGKAHLRRYASIPGVTIAAASDVNAEELAKVAAEFNIEKTYADFRQLLQQEDLVAVDVCLHNNLHAPVTIEALKAGKHVFCEKPIAGAYIDGKAMVDAATKTGRMLSIQLNRLFNKETKIAKRLIDAGRLGKPYHARSLGFRRRGRPYVDGYGTENFVRKEISAGGALIDMGIYHISEMLYLLGDREVTRISGKVYQETGMDEERRAKSGYNVEELGMGFVRFADGATLDIIESWALHLDGLESSWIVGPEGGIRLNPLSYHTTLDDVEVNAQVEVTEIDRRRHLMHATETAYDSPQHHWAAALRGEVPLLPTAEIALQTMLISEGIYLSDKLGREVTLEETVKASQSKSLKI